MEAAALPRLARRRQRASREPESCAETAPLILLSGADFLSVFTRPELDALALGFLRLRGNGIHIAMASWGLWLFPFGRLVVRSGFTPRTLGVLERPKAPRRVAAP